MDMAETAESKYVCIHLCLRAEVRRKLECAVAYERTTINHFVLVDAVRR